MGPAVSIMHAYCFFSVHFRLFDAIAASLIESGDVDSISGFVWGKHDLDRLQHSPVPYDLSNTVQFTDVVQRRASTDPLDLEWLRKREEELGFSLRRAIAAERHLLAGRSYEEVLALTQAILRVVAEAYDEADVDFVFTEDLSCLSSILHWALARERGIPFWCIGSARLPNRVMLYESGFQHWERTLEVYESLDKLSPEDAAWAEEYLRGFRNRPVQPTGMKLRSQRPGVGLDELRRLIAAQRRYRADPADPVSMSGGHAAWRRLTRLARIARDDVQSVFEAPVPGERYVLYPIHFQPEASTLVQAPMYLDQVALVEEIAKSLPIGTRLYVKEHVSSRGRRPREFYEQLASVCGVRLIGPDADSWSLIRDAAAVAVITGTMGWEALLFGKPAVVFGDIFYDHLPGVFLAREHAKDEWYSVFREVLQASPPDESDLKRYLVALRDSSFEGFMGNPETFPRVMEPANVEALTDALRTVLG